MNNKFSENLKKVRKDHNLSQEQLAEDLGVSRQAISKWESGAAYPEMDKIIMLCDKFDLNIDDLLHHDIREVKKEEERKKTLNNYINNALDFITNSINMFMRMSFGSKLKFICEQVIIICLLALLSDIIISVFQGVFGSLFYHLPDLIHSIIERIILSVLGLICFLSSIVIVIHVFKARYLDYYLKSENITKTKKEDVSEEDETTEDSVKLETKKDRAIVIRDEKHSSGRFFNFVITAIVVLFKAFLLWCMIPFILCAGGLAFGLITSFLLFKTGLFFIGLLLGFSAALVIVVDILTIILNFVFNRQGNKKIYIGSFLIALIVGGISCGLIFMGTLKFDSISSNDPSVLTTETKEYNMNNELVIFPYSPQYELVEFKEENIDNIKVEYFYNKYNIIEDYMDEKNNQLTVTTKNTNATKSMRGFIEQLNNYKLVNVFDAEEVTKITVYASKENIEILKANVENYNKKLTEQDELRNIINEQKTRIQELEKEINELKKDSE